MALTTPFAYNPSKTPIPGTQQVGDFAIGITEQDYSQNPGGVKWWNGPDEDNRYIIGVVNPNGDQPTPISGEYANFGFFGSVDKTDQSLIDLTNMVSGSNFSTVQEATAWMSSQGVYVNYDSPDTGSTYPTDGLMIHYDLLEVDGYDSGNNIINNLSVENNANVLDLQVYGTTSLNNGVLSFDGSTGYAESPSSFNDIWSYLDFTNNPSFTVYGSFYSTAQATSGVGFGKFGGYELFTRQWSTSAAYTVTDGASDGTSDFVSIYTDTYDFGAQIDTWFQAGLRVTYNSETGLSSVEFLYNGKSLETWLSEYDGPVTGEGEPLNPGPARFAWYNGTSTETSLDWPSSLDGWQTAPFRIARHQVDNYYAPNKLSYFTHYNVALSDGDILKLHNYYQTRYE